MGTEIQSKMNLHGYYSRREPDNNVGSNGWPLNFNCRASESKSTSGTTKEEFLQHAKEKLRQTMLMHESIFRHQLKELHRVYRVQKDMMNELKGKITIYSSSNPYDDERRRCNHPNGSVEKFDYGRSSNLKNDGIQTPSSTNEKSMKYKAGPSQNGVNLNDCPSLESKCKKLQRRLFDLDLPADEYIDSQDKQPDVSGASMVDSYSSVTNFGLPQMRYDGLDSTSLLNFGCSRDGTSSHISTRRPFSFTDLNGKVEKASGSTSGDSLGILKCAEIGRQNLSVNSFSGFHDNHQKIDKEGKGAGLSFVHPGNGMKQRGWPSYSYEAGNSRSDGISFARSSYPEDSCISFKSRCENRIISEAEVPVQFDEKKTGQHHERTVFGVEIARSNHFESFAALQRLGFNPSFTRSDASISEPFTDLSSEEPSSFKRNAMSSLEDSFSRASTQFNKNDLASIQNLHGIIDERIRSSLPSRDKMHSSDSLGKSLQLEFQELGVSNPSIISVQPHGIKNGSAAYEPVQLNATRNPGGLDFMMEKKSSNYVNTGIPHFQRPRNEDGQRKQEYQQGGTWWFKSRPQTSSEYANRTEGSYSTYSGGLKIGYEADSSLVLGTKKFQHNTHTGDISTPTKLPSFPVMSKPHVASDFVSPCSSQSPLFGCVRTGGSIADHVNITARSEAHIEDSLSAGGRSVNGHANLRHEFDLNLTAVEEEAEAAEISPRSLFKISSEKSKTGLEAALLLKNENVKTNSESRIMEQPKLILHELGESLADRTRIAAEAIVAISSSSPVHADDLIICQHPEASLDNPLHWFTDIIFSQKDDMVGAVSGNKDDACHEDTVPKGLDYFEYMTLKLTEIPAEECIFKPEAPEPPENERPSERRPQRGQAKRRRQRKDFQRDILPGLTFLSKYEVTEDLQTFRSLIRAAGGRWESGIAQRNVPKGSSGRGRKRSRNSAPSPSKTSGSQPHTQQSTSRETSLCEGRLTGWGKKTKRLPRRRCQLNQSCVE